MEREKVEWCCAWCQTDGGPVVLERRGALWLPVAQTHGICATCLEKHFPANEAQASR